MGEKQSSVRTPESSTQEKSKEEMVLGVPAVTNNEKSHEVLRPKNVTARRVRDRVQ